MIFFSIQEFHHHHVYTHLTVRSLLELCRNKQDHGEHLQTCFYRVFIKALGQALGRWIEQKCMYKSIYKEPGHQGSAAKFKWTCVLKQGSTHHNHFSLLAQYTRWQLVVVLCPSLMPIQVAVFCRF